MLIFRRTENAHLLLASQLLALLGIALKLCAVPREGS